MKSWVSIALVGLILCSFMDVKDARMIEIAYIERFAPLAVEEMHRVGIPASIKLAQAVVESNAGRSALAAHSNNHFGIKCKSYWTGMSYYHKDDDLDYKGKLMESCFRAYQDIEASFRDHSDFLKSSNKYTSLFELDATDYKAWANGLKSCGYATDKSYATKLIQTIEDFQLYRYDTFQSPMYDLPLHSSLSIPLSVKETTVD